MASHALGTGWFYIDRSQSGEFELCGSFSGGYVCEIVAKGLRLD